MTPTTRTTLKEAAESMDEVSVADALLDVYRWHSSCMASAVHEPPDYIASLTPSARIWLILLILEAEK